MAASTVQVSLVEQVGSAAFRVAWYADDDAGTLWQVNVNTGSGWYVLVDLEEPKARELVVPLYLDDGDILYGVRIDAEPEGVSGSWDPDITWANPYTDADPTWAPANTAAATIRYTTLADVKARLQITGTEWDTILTQAIISAEIAMDKWLGRSFPDSGDNPEFPYIPVDIRQAAGNLSVAMARQMDAPFGTSGSSDLFGEIDLGDQVRTALERSPLLRGYRAQWGVS